MKIMNTSMSCLLIILVLFKQTLNFWKLLQPTTKSAETCYTELTSAHWKIVESSQAHITFLANKVLFTWTLTTIDMADVALSAVDITVTRYTVWEVVVPNTTAVTKEYMVWDTKSLLIKCQLQLIIADFIPYKKNSLWGSQISVKKDHSMWLQSEKAINVCSVDGLDL